MKIIDVKIPKRLKKEMETMKSPIEAERDQWPYGLRLTFESEQVDKLPHLEKMKVGQKVDVMGMGEVTSIRMHEEKEGKKKYSVEVQLHEVGCEGKGKMAHESMGDAMKRAEGEKRA